MTRSQTPTSHAARNDDLLASSASEPIVEDDEALEQAVAGAELPVLLAALAAALGETCILAPGLRPPLTPFDTAPLPHGGMSPEQQDEARTVALAAMKRLRARGITTVDTLSEEATRTILDYLAAGHSEWFPILEHELALSPTGRGAPTWSLDEMTGRTFPVLIVGAGIAGIAAAYRCAQAGLPVTHIEASSSLGGTWAKNIYPGVRLDTPTFGYSYSFAQKADWPHQFARGSEILDYLQTVADKTGVSDNVELSTRLVRLRWDEAECLWEAATRGSDGAERTRRFAGVITAVGPLDRPLIPDFEGRETFKGVEMHSQEWDPDIDLTGRRVAVIGTGASAYQIVPSIVDDVASLTVFQRSAPWMLPAPTYHDPLPASFRWLVRKVPQYAQWFRLWVNLQGIPGRMHTVTADPEWPGAPASVSQKNHEVREMLVQRLKEQFRDAPELLEHVIPHYPPGAKRMLRDNGEWARSLLAHNTTLVTCGIERLSDTGVIDTQGTHHEIDVIIYATGFKPSDYLESIEVVGRGGLEIHDYWQGDARAFNCTMVPGFPNLFMLFGPNTGGVVAGSTHFMLERAAEFTVKAIGEVVQRGADAIDVRQEALDRFIDWVDEGNRGMAWGQPYVKTWYQNRFGRVSQIWPYTTAEFWDITERIDPADHTFMYGTGERR